MKTRKITALLLSATMMAAMGLTGCGSGSTGGTASESAKTDTQAQSQVAAGGATELTFWTLNTRQNAVEPIVADFNQKNSDIHITVSFYDTDGIKDACKVAASSNTLPSIWFNWGGSLGGFYVENGLTYDLAAYAKANDWESIYSAGALELCTLHDKLSGYPTSFNALDIYYRKDIYEKYGIQIPSTFEEFEAACATLKENGITPISTAGLKGWHVMRFVELLIEHYAGAELHDDLNNMTASWDNEAVVKALAKYQEFCDKGYFPTGFVTADPNDTRMAMVMGTAAMDVQGPWYDGDIIQDGVDINLFGTFPFPSGGSNRVSAFAEMVQFNNNLSEEQLAAAIKFMDFYYNDENVEAYSEYFNRPLPKNGAETPADLPNVMDILSTANKNGTFTITDQAFPTEVADTLFDAQDALANHQMTPEEAAKSIQAAIEAYKNKQ